MRRAPLLLAPFVALAAVVALAMPASAADRETLVRVYHQPTSPTLVQGSGLGAVRTFFVPMAVEGKAADGQFLTGTLTTVVSDYGAGTELRASNLTFVFGDETDQLVVGGVSVYPAAGATLAPGQKTTRPVVGGSGRFAGARGYLVSVNNGPAGWLHTFHLLH